MGHTFEARNMDICLLHVERRTMTSDRHQIWHTDREYEYDGAV